MSSSSQPAVTLSVVSHGNGPEIDRLLESLRLCEQTSRLQMILTDNLGQDLPEHDRSLWGSFITVRNEHPLGFAKNHNRAFRMAVSDYFCILNPDVAFEQEVFSSLIDVLERREADIAAPLIVDSSGTVQDSFRDLPRPLEILRRRLPGYKYGIATSEPAGMLHPDWLAGIFLFMRSETYRQLGGLNESYRLYFEDVEFCTRARLSGWKLALDPSVHVRHDAQRASRKKPAYLIWHLQSAVRFFTSPVYKLALKNKP